ncbi:S9 family peptidase [Thalassorhabdomicrobium marinisediminis]|nr:alpha/beta fold hydrolase [Thalassorhabdomicrobium marinisediminis]
MTGLTDELWAQIAPLMPWNLRKTFTTLRVDPHWFPDSRGFWYRRQTAEGVEFVIVDAESGDQRLAFATDALSRALAAVTTEPEAALERVELLDRDGLIGLDGRSYSFDGETLTLQAMPRVSSDALTSPDGTRALLRKDGDLWLRDVASGTETRLTQSAEPHFEWAKSPDQNLESMRILREGIRLPPIAQWAPDGRHVLTFRLDERNVRSFPMVQNVPDDGSRRPVLHDLRIAFTGDVDLPMAHQAVIDTLTGEIVWQQGGPVHVTETSLIERAETWWSHDSSRFYFVDHDRYEQWIALIEVDRTTGARREIIRETSDYFVDVNMEYARRPNIMILDKSDEAIWFSQRDGWAHLYLVDLSSGATKQQITKGAWVVRDILALDEEARTVFFLAGGIGKNQTPYQRSLCSADLDTGEVTVLTPEAGDCDVPLHVVGWEDMVQRAGMLGARSHSISPDCAYFVYSHAPPDRLPSARLCRRDGSVIAELETAQSTANDLVWPATFSTLAADNATEIFAQVWLPKDKTAPASVPMVELIYPGPQCIEQTLSPFPADAGEFAKAALANALVRLGIGVVIIDARGTPFREKALHDLCHGQLHNPGHLNDHAKAIADLCAAYPQIDPARIAIMGHSAGGHAAARALFDHPDTYSAAIATAGSHDPQLYNHCWPEKWQGRLVRHADGSTNYDAADNSSRAEHLRGALLLGHGDIDDNVHPAQTQRLAAALIKAGKTFEMLITPNDDHYTFSRSPYVLRREIDFLLRQLQPETGG